MPNTGDWVLIHSQTLKKEERAPQVPADTKEVPLEMWVKGELLEPAEIGDAVTVKTLTGRLETGKLIEVNPVYRHSFGEFVPELVTVSRELRQLLGGEPHE
ncbi:MAG: 2-amino-4-oxopentanoate thiolase subunit OrtA [Turicibacter sp.]|nr:2-amino-4-oxopentanoate thiolase subunit OrtA [Turicibacter sp.]